MDKTRQTPTVDLIVILELFSLISSLFNLLSIIGGNEDVFVLKIISLSNTFLFLLSFVAQDFFQITTFLCLKELSNKL
jgi:hypothetical protein